MNRKKEKVILFIISFALLCIVSFTAETKAQTDFTGYIAISTPQDLNKLNYSDYNSKFYLTNDIDLKSYGYWESIEEFKGVFDGNGYTINNLTSMTGGLFSYLDGATIRNLSLTNVSIEGSIGNAGGIATGSFAATIENCYVSGSIKANIVGGSIGGIIGYLKEGTIRNCVNEAMISAPDSYKKYTINGSVITHSTNGGGIAGDASLSLIENCINKGTVSFRGNAGGILGEASNELKINNSFNCGYISGDVGGSLVGVMDENSYIYSSYYTDYPGVGKTMNSITPTGTYASTVQSDYIDWDFTSTWIMVSGINDGYPILQWSAPHYQLETPVANMRSDTYSSKFTVELMHTVKDATIYYTTDGKTPTKDSSVYQGSITIDKSTTLKAMAVYKNFKVSEIAAYDYKFKFNDPKADKKSESSYSATTKITLTADAGATIYYTINGKTPTTASAKYTAPISISKDTTIKAIAAGAGKDASEVSTFVYYVSAANPTSNKTAGTYADAFKVKLATKTKGAVVYYTTDGTTPTNKSQKYNGEFTISKSTTVKAIAINGAVKSKVSTFKYVIKPTQPTANKASGVYASSIEVKLATAIKNATIYYTTNGKTPTAKSKKYTAAFKVSSNTVVKAIVMKGETKSNVLTLDYKFKVQTPATDKAGGQYSGTQKVKLSSSTKGATIYYTTDGTTPTEFSMRYTGAIKLMNGVIFKAIAMKDNMEKSDVLTVYYTIY